MIRQLGKGVHCSTLSAEGGQLRLDLGFDVGLSLNGRAKWFLCDFRLNHSLKMGSLKHIQMWNLWLWTGRPRPESDGTQDGSFETLGLASQSGALGRGHGKQSSQSCFLPTVAVQ